MRTLSVLFLIAGLLAPTPAFASNDYPGGGGLGAPSPQQGVSLTPADERALEGIIAPPLLPGEQTEESSGPTVVVQPPRSQVRAGSGSLRNAIVPLVTATQMPPSPIEWNNAARPTGSYIQLFPSASQPTSSSLPTGYFNLSPGQLYPSANQPASSTAARPAGAVGAPTTPQSANSAASGAR